MSEPRGYIANDPVVMDVWKRLTKLFAVWRLIVIASFTRRVLYQFTNDQMSTLMRSGHWKIALGLLGGLNDPQLDFLAEWSRLNAARSERIFRTTTLILVSIPVAAVFGVSEMDPEFWQRIGFARPESLMVIIGLWLLVSGILMAAAWRSRDLADLIALEQARRKLRSSKLASATQ
ncbi:hypothetical protein Mmar10_1551 [Maricaulis maris MCS10]|uniref:Uncharacterized protein n=1 Tax=Maricaulis maris (strain MCS10) TaxID=394221 RepID=Q0APE4_MARMM|nr:hypothetical protein [Maricaulis maris]ABI65843.1 hypothetical protein Mmar10_1551 [Maricaulis maris MCS10]